MDQISMADPSGNVQRSVRKSEDQLLLPILNHQFRFCDGWGSEDKGGRFTMQDPPRREQYAAARFVSELALAGLTVGKPGMMRDSNAKTARVGLTEDKVKRGTTAEERFP